MSFHNHRVLPRRAHRFSIGSIALQSIQIAAGVRFESVHSQVRPNFGFDYYMNMIGSHVRGVQNPAAVRTNLAQRAEHARSSFCVEEIKRLVHLLTFHLDTRGSGRRQSASERIVTTVD